MKRSLMLAIILAAYPAMARADNFRCPNGSIVSTGDSISEVVVKCDPPTNRVRRSEGDETSHGRVRYVEVEEWTYNEGLNTLVHYLVFRDGILVEVRTGTFGR